MGAYLVLASAGVRARLSYPGAFVLRVAAIATGDAAVLLLLGIVLGQFTTVAGWRFNQVALLWGLMQAAGGLSRTLTWPLDHFEELIVSGDFDTYLTRPLSPLLQLLCNRLDLTHLGGVVIGLTVLAFVFRFAGVPATPGNIALAALSVAAGVVMLMSLTLLVAALSFWQTRTGKLQDIVQGATRGFAELPLSIYPAPVRALLTFVLPLGLCTYYPALRMLGRPSGWEAFAALPASLVLAGIALAVWRLGLRRYQSTGS